jgi:hypothetical protein
MKYLISTSLAIFALAFVLLPPIDTSGGICLFNLADTDDSNFNCSVSFRSVVRINNSQAANQSDSQSFTINTGGNHVYAGDDVQSASITSGAPSITYSRTSILNRFELTIN